MLRRFISRCGYRSLTVHGSNSLGRWPASLTTDMMASRVLLDDDPIRPTSLSPSGMYVSDRERGARRARGLRARAGRRRALRAARGARRRGALPAAGAAGGCRRPRAAHRLPGRRQPDGGPGGRRLHIEELPRTPLVAVSPDGRWRVACGAEDCKVYGDEPRPVGGWENLPVSPHVWRHDYSPSILFAPDAAHLAFLNDAGNLYLVSLPDGKPRRLGNWKGTWSGNDDGSRGWIADVKLADALAWLGAAR